MPDNTDPMDERKRYEWESKYPPEARKIIFAGRMFPFSNFFYLPFFYFCNMERMVQFNAALM